MATKLTVSIIFLLFTLSYAQYQHEFPQRDVVLKDDVADLPESDSKDSNIFLPSQKTEPETREIDPEIIISGDSKPDEAESAPLTFVSFRPVNRHFRQGPVLPFRHGRRCGGFRRRGMVKPWLMRFNGGEMPYGKDMIEEKEGSAAEHSEVREMPEKIERFDFGSEMDVVPLGRHHPHRHHHGFFEGEEEEKREKSEEEHGGVREMPEKIERIGFGSEMDIVPLGRHHPHRHHHHPDFFVREDEERREKHHERDDDQEEEEEHHRHHPHPHHHDDHHDDGFLWKIRKFLPHF